jgi:hypothetical protein
MFSPGLSMTAPDFYHPAQKNFSQTGEKRENRGER